MKKWFKKNKATTPILEPTETNPIVHNKLPVVSHPNQKQKTLNIKSWFKFKKLTIKTTKPAKLKNHKEKKSKTTKKKIHFYDEKIAKKDYLILKIKLKTNQLTLVLNPE
ncbi:hypothetical protein [Spiroplasma endosymbiont of Virgichneumon dumeticola]|uniref:hypothetical protein n=1 Tax=Spiroplasma endosymbiont of Virgichneumon dumeticola TaxID=3139323 RepID=UPI0035C8D4EE